MIRFGGVSVWHDDWGDPTRLFLAAIVTVVTGAGVLKMNATGRVGRAGDAFFADRLDDPVKFHALLIVLGMLFLMSLVLLASTAWDLVVAFRRDSGGA